MLAEVVDVQIDELCIRGEDGRLAPVEADAERGADPQDEVRLAQRLAARAGEEKWMAGGEDTSRHAVDVQRQVRAFDEALLIVLAVGPPHAGAGNHGGPIPLAQQSGNLLDLVWVPKRTQGGGEMLGRPRHVRRARQHVQRNVPESGAGPGAAYRAATTRRP